MPPRGVVQAIREVVKRAYRLRRPDQFRRVRRDGKTLNHKLLRLTVAPNRRKKTRCGFVVSKRLGNAVLRNRAKRRTREAVRLLFDHIVQGTDIVFVIRSAEVAAVPFPMLQDTVRHLLQRAGIWTDTAAAHIEGAQQEAVNRSSDSSM